MDHQDLGAYLGDKSEKILVEDISNNNSNKIKLCSNEKVMKTLQTASAQKECTIDKQLKALEDDLNHKIRLLSKKKRILEKALKIIKKYEQEKKTLCLIDKWRGISQSGLSYMTNAMMIKINKMGGYKAFRISEIESKKEQIEYQINMTVKDEVNAILESSEFETLSEDIQEEIKNRMDEKMDEMEKQKEREFEKLDNELRNCDSEDMSIGDLAKRLNINYELVFPQLKE